MSDITLVVACAQCRVFWPVDADQPTCTVPEHHHQQHEMHRHRTPVALPDGTALMAVSFDVTDPYGRDRLPDFGLYLDGVWQPPWPHERVAWPDFGVPDDPACLVVALRELLERARNGQRVEIGCLGGHGRTGTALACLAVLSGHPATEAVSWVRAQYCPKAVETDEQVAFVADLPV